MVEIDAGISIVPESKVIQEIDKNLPADHFNSPVNIGVFPFCAKVDVIVRKSRRLRSY